MKEQNKQVSSIYEHNDPPKPKVDKDNEAILNKEDDNSYEEPVTDNIPKTQESNKEKAEKQEENFEYKNEGEFDNGSDIKPVNPEEEYL